MATTIQIAGKTLERLKFFKQFAKESYDEVINKLLDEVEEGELSESSIRDIQAGLKEVRQGKGERIEDVARQLGVKL
jgi:predicted CopG family antitoxin